MADETAEQGKKKESVITVLLEHGLKARAVVPRSQAKINVTPTYILRFTVFWRELESSITMTMHFLSALDFINIFINHFQLWD